MRGEYFSETFYLLDFEGSPPLAWGIPIRAGFMLTMRRITPTCVGNTDHWGWIPSVSRDHPHLRGEYFLTWPRPAAIKGSPPLAWGIQLAIDKLGNLVGITPTCVGNTIRSVLRAQSRAGSPPLAWGILNLFLNKY